MNPEQKETITTSPDGTRRSVTYRVGSNLIIKSIVIKNPVENGWSSIVEVNPYVREYSDKLGQLNDEP